jgi:hypothetical protein
MNSSRTPKTKLLEICRLQKKYDDGISVWEFPESDHENQ